MADDGGSSGGGDYDWAIPLVIVLIGWYLLSSFLSPQQANEKVAEDTAEEELGVTTGEDGQISTTRRSGKSETEEETVVSMEIPDDWPSSVPILSEVNIEYVDTKEEQNEKIVSTVTFTTTESVEDINNFYLKELDENGWEVEIQTDTGNGSVITAKQGRDETVSVFITGINNRETSVTLSVTEGD